MHVEEHGLTPFTNLDPCDVTFLYDYRFALADGRLTVTPQRLRLDYDTGRTLCVGIGATPITPAYQGVGTRIRS